MKISRNYYKNYCLLFIIGSFSTVSGYSSVGTDFGLALAEDYGRRGCDVETESTLGVGGESCQTRFDTVVLCVDIDHCDVVGCP